MILCLLAIQSSCKWWEFNEGEYQKYVNDSLRHPILATFTIFYFPHSIEVRDSFQKYAESLGTNTPIVFTNIECMHTRECFRIGISNFPTILLIRGTNPRYWKRCNDLSPDGWNEFLRINGPAALQVKSNIQLGDPVQNSYLGSSSFHLIITNASLAYLRKYRRIAKQMKMYGGMFTFRIKKEARPVLRVYFSPLCVHKLRDLDLMEDFIKTNIFSHFHNYSPDELNMRNRSMPLVLANVDTLSMALFDIFNNFSSRYCDTFQIGATTSEEIPLLFNKTKNHRPFFAFNYEKSNCTVVYSKNIMKASERGLFDFMLRVQSKNTCSPFIEGHYYTIPTNWKRIKFASYLAAFVIILFIISMIKSSKNIDDDPLIM